VARGASASRARRKPRARRRRGSPSRLPLRRRLVPPHGGPRNPQPAGCARWWLPVLRHVRRWRLGGFCWCCCCCCGGGGRGGRGYRAGLPCPRRRPRPEHVVVRDASRAAGFCACSRRHGRALLSHAAARVAPPACVNGWFSLPCCGRSLVSCFPPAFARVERPARVSFCPPVSLFGFSHYGWRLQPAFLVRVAFLLPRGTLL
jgi:hypothetical protein